MPSVTVEPPALTGDALATATAISAAFKAAAAEKGIEKGLRISLVSQSLELVWADELEGTPGMIKKITTSKARSFFGGKELLSPSPGATMCCHLCPWLCGCTDQMAVQGTVACEVAGTSAACLVVAGAPAGSTDLAVAEMVLTKCGFTKGADGAFKKGGAPPVADMAR